MRLRYSCLLVLMLLVAGCGKSGPEIAPVSGRITVDGQPMENIDVLFQPEVSGSPSYGRTDKEGRYTLGYKRGVAGALVGQHGVSISASGEVVKNAPRIKNTELHREVKSGKNVNMDFDVTSEGK